jgi:hypothetical protein
MHRQVRTTPLPGCCIDRPVADAAAVAGDPTRAVSGLLLEDRRTDAVLVSESLHHSTEAAFTVTPVHGACRERPVVVLAGAGGAVLVVEVEGSGR